MDIEEKQLKKPHDAFFRWLFADSNHLRLLLELAGKVNVDVADFLAAVNFSSHSGLVFRSVRNRRCGFGFPCERRYGSARICGNSRGTQVRP